MAGEKPKTFKEKVDALQQVVLVKLQAQAVPEIDKFNQSVPDAHYVESRYMMTAAANVKVARTEQDLVIEMTAEEVANDPAISMYVAPEPVVADAEIKQDQAPAPALVPQAGRTDEAAPVVAEAPPMRAEFEEKAGQIDPDLQRLEVLLPEDMPQDPKAYDDRLYVTSVNIMNNVRGGRISQDQLDGLIEQFEGHEGGADYAKQLERLKDVPPPNIIKDLYEVNNVHKNGAPRVRPQRPSVVNQEPVRPSRPAEPVVTPPAKSVLNLDDQPVLDKNGEVITVNLGEGRGVQALWQNGEGEYELLNAEELTARLGAIGKDMNKLMAELEPAQIVAERLTWTKHINKFSSSIDEVIDDQHNGGVATYDISKVDADDLDPRIQAALHRESGDIEAAAKIEADFKQQEQAVPDDVRGPQSAAPVVDTMRLG